MKAHPLLLAILWVGTAAVAAPRADLALQPQARVSEPQVTLGDIARLQSEDLALIRRLVNLPVGQAPQPGQSAMVQRQVLAEWLRRTTGLAEDALRWSGAQASRVVRASHLLRGEDIGGAAVEAVRTLMAGSGQHGELHVRGSVRDVEVPEGKVRLLPRPMEAGSALRHRMLVWVDAWVGDRFIRSFAVTVEATDLLQRPLEERAARELVVPAPTADRREAATAVARGEWAALRTTSGAVSLESRVEVLQDGRVGQRVRVRTSASAAGVLFARVIGPGQLELAP